MKFSLLICFSLFVAAAANCQVATPSVGYVRYADGGVRGIYGLEGNYIVGKTVLARAEAASFSDGGGLLFNSGFLVLVDSKFETLATAEIDERNVVLRLTGALNTAIAWLPDSQALVHWNGTSFVKAVISGIPPEDTVTSVQKLNANTVSLLASKPDNTVLRYRISLQTGEVKSSTALPGASGYVFDNSDRILCFKDRKISIFSQIGETLQTLPLPVENGLLIEQASSDCLHLTTTRDRQDWLLHTDGNDFRLYRLATPRKSAPSASAAVESVR